MATLVFSKKQNVSLGGGGKSMHSSICAELWRTV